MLIQVRSVSVRIGRTRPRSAAAAGGIPGFSKLAAAADKSAPREILRSIKSGQHASRAVGGRSAAIGMAEQTIYVDGGTVLPQMSGIPSE
jgi:hypothetical protein